MVLWCPGRQRKRRAMYAFPPFMFIKSSLATKSTIGRLAEGGDSRMEHARHAEINALPVVAPRTSNSKLRTIRPLRPKPLNRLGLGYLNAASECICSERLGRHRNLELELDVSTVLDWFLIEGLQRSDFNINVSAGLCVSVWPRSCQARLTEEKFQLQLMTRVTLASMAGPRQVRGSCQSN